LMTSVEVDINDKAFKNPTKRIGKMVSKEEADKLAAEKKWVFKEEQKENGGYRRVVPSPQPKDIMNWEVVENNARQGTIVIAVGGGGIPVYYDEKGDLRPAEAVIDKDLASSVLARQIKADRFYILTDVPFVYANFGKPDQKVLEFLDINDTKNYLEAGTFGEGSMAPKINAALQFVEGGGEMSVITESKKLEDKSFGTKITKEYDNADMRKYDNVK